MPRLSTLAVVALSAAVLGGCGREALRAGDLDYQAAGPSRVFPFPEVGMRFRAPGNLPLGPSAAPGIFRAAAGDAFVAGFAYRRAEQLPRSRRELATARRRLVAATRKRSRTYRLRSARSTRAAGAPAIELLGDQRLSNGRLRTRSLHIYKGRAEYVIELAARTRDFAYLDREVYRPIRRSLRVTGKVRRRR